MVRDSVNRSAISSKKRAIKVGIGKQEIDNGPCGYRYINVSLLLNIVHPVYANSFMVHHDMKQVK